MATNTPLYTVYVRGATGWHDQIGDNAPRSYAECEEDIEALKQLGDGFPDDDDDYRIEPVAQDH